MGKKPLTHSEVSRLGGMAGKGKAKKRTRAQYQEMARLSAIARRAKKVD